MSSIFSQGHKALYSPVSDIQPGSLGLGDHKRAAWAFAIGEYRASVDPPVGRASRRGDLPDVDFSQLVRAPRRSLWSRIRQAFRATSSRAPALEEQLELPLPLPAARAQPANVIPFRRAA